MDRRLRTPPTLVTSIAIFGIGLALSFTLVGMIAAPLLMGGAAFGVFYVLARVRASERGFAWLRWTGVHSYSLFIVHQPFVLLFLASGVQQTASRIAIGALATVLASLVAALALERALAAALTAVSHIYRRGRMAGVTVAAVGLGFIGALLLLGANAVVARMAPQEVYGRGERPSLQPDPIVEWKLIPNRTTRLRWTSYDYRVTANALGYPGPNVPLAKPAGAFRIMTTGDAFTSAEGVDTDRAWPRLLERKLRAQNPRRVTQVMNFAITGYGPNQYAATIRNYGPKVHPDVILMELFTNDYEDVLETDEQFRRSIGFDLPEPGGLQATLSLQQLREFIRHHVTRPLQTRLFGRPNQDGRSSPMRTRSIRTESDSIRPASVCGSD